MSITKYELNSHVQEELRAFFSVSVNGKNPDFIRRQPENPDPNASVRISATDMTMDKARELIGEARKEIWGE